MTDPSAPAGWYNDPYVPGQWRYWDGDSWTTDSVPGSSPRPTDPPEDSDRNVAKPAAEEPAAAQSNKNVGIGCLAIIVILFIIGAIGSLFENEDSGGSGGGGDSSADAGDEIGAQVVCEDFVEDRLKSPSTADFSETEVTGVEPEFTVTGAVDSENSFGAAIRNTYSCTVMYTGNDNWRLVELTGLAN